MSRYWPLLLLALAFPADAQGGCISAIAVDGVLLLGTGPARGLPPADGRVEAILPACNDTPPIRDPDQRTTATRIRGLPPAVAVRHHREIHVAPGSLIPVAGHPLRRYFRSWPRPRAGCRRMRLQGRVEGAWHHGFSIGRAIRADGRTRVVNRPPYQPLIEGQRVRVAASRCGSRTYADRIAFVGPDARPERFVADFTSSDGFDEGLPVELLLIVIVPALFVGGLFLALRI